MVKNTTLREDKVLNELKKAFPTYSFGNYIDMARLIQPQSFDYKNRSRLESEFTKKIIQGISDITLVLQYVNAKHKAEILTSDEFNNFMTRIMDFSKFGNVDEDYLASFYPNMVLQVVAIRFVLKRYFLQPLYFLALKSPLILSLAKQIRKQFLE